MLEPATLNPIPDHVQPPPLPITVDDKLEFEISETLDYKIDNHHCACKLLYLVYWTGYEGTEEETSWILTSELGLFSFSIEVHTLLQFKKNSYYYFTPL